MYKIIILFILSFSSILQAKSIRFDYVEVDALLNKEGHLEVKENQAMYFNGEWNGGYREFRVEGKQKVIVHGIDRTTTVGILEPLKRGNINKKFHYQFRNNKLKWRNRLPYEPPFNNIFRRYIIKYTIKNVIQHNKQDVFLNHQFLFKRDSPIKTVKVKLTIDPFWESEKGVYEFTAENVAAKNTFLKKVRLGDVKNKKFKKFLYISAGPTNPIGWEAISVFILIFIGYIFFRYKMLYRHEEKNGRFAALTPHDQINAEWIEKNVLIHKPEIAAALWDERTCAHELSALMTSLHVRGYIKISFEEEGFWMFKHPTFVLEKLKPFDDLEEYERKILKGLFIKDLNRITQSELKTYYRFGFVKFFPIQILSYGIDEFINERGGLRDKQTPNLSVLLTLSLGFLAFIGFLSIFLFDTNYKTVAILGMTVFFALAPTIPMVILSFFQARQILHPEKSIWVIPLYACVPFCLFATFLYKSHIPMGFGHWLYVLFTSMFMADIVFLFGTNRNSKVKLDVRQKLASAYLYFKEELKEKKPNLKDEWLPYLIGFGLEKNLARWDIQYGSTYHYVGSTNNNVGSSQPSWTGGGGDFAGAGVSGSWATSLGQIGSSASSSGSGGSSGGGSGSSGGGGGGGW